MTSIWVTVGDLQNGIERLLLDGPKPLGAICRAAALHGVGDMQTIRSVHALRDGGRLEAIDGPGMHFKLSDWNKAELLKEPHAQD